MTKKTIYPLKALRTVALAAQNLHRANDTDRPPDSQAIQTLIQAIGLMIAAGELVAETAAAMRIFLRFHQAEDAVFEAAANHEFGRKLVAAL